MSQGPARGDRGMGTGDQGFYPGEPGRHLQVWWRGAAGASCGDLKKKSPRLPMSIMANFQLASN